MYICTRNPDTAEAYALATTPWCDLFFFLESGLACSRDVHVDNIASQWDEQSHNLAPKLLRSYFFSIFAVKKIKGNALVTCAISKTVNCANITFSTNTSTTTTPPSTYSIYFITPKGQFSRKTQILHPPPPPTASRGSCGVEIKKKERRVHNEMLRNELQC